MRALALLLALAAALAALAALAACTTRPVHDPREIFDEDSGSTLVVVAKPLVFARERSDVAAHARDYATLVAVEDDRSGQYTHYLLLYRWSTVDPRMSPPPRADEGELRFLADGRTIDLKPLERPPTSLAQGHALHVPDHGDIVYRSYKVDTAMLEFIAASHDLTLRMPQEMLDTPFALWEDGRGALAQFLQASAAPAKP